MTAHKANRKRNLKRKAERASNKSASATSSKKKGATTTTKSTSSKKRRVTSSKQTASTSLEATHHPADGFCVPDHVGANTANPSQSPLAGPSGLPTSSEPLLFDLVSEEQNDCPQPITWTANNGIRVRTEFPYCTIPGEGSKNMLWKAAEVLTSLADLGLTEESVDELMVVDRSQHTESAILDLASACLSVNKPMLVRGSRLQDDWKHGISDKVLGDLGIQDRRQCDVFNFVQRETTALRGGTDVSPNDQAYERVLPPLPGQDQWYLPAPDLDEPVDVSETENMEFGSFLARVRGGESLYILDFPTASDGGIPYRSLDHTDICLNNTKWLADAMVWRDLTWGLVHGGQVITWLHHDGDGKATAATAETGAKIWTLFVPNPSLSLEKVQDVHLWLAERKDKLPDPALGKILNVFLMRGDTLFMPPGIIHMVYTPVPSIFRGSSFWNFHFMHLSAFSLKADSTAGDILTNVDHSSDVIFDTIIRLVLAIPVVPKFRLHRSVIYNFYDILTNPQDYIHVAPTDTDYPSPKVISATERALKKKSKKSKSQTLSHPSHHAQAVAQSITSVKEAQVLRLRSTLFLDRAVRILEHIIAADGRDLPLLTTKKSIYSKNWVAELRSGLSWMAPGPVIEDDRDALLRIARGEDENPLSELSDLSSSESSV
ncbi:hypothetical protein V5O48_007891 [Marasmius crinis-equi]|uniref:JmjC domain-containing protein n=1 Tax=Marasmius crinis-equi TaxID=585013 RepID=A0ABR3FFE6_9AGAR